MAGSLDILRLLGMGAAFRRNERGTVAIIFAAILIPIIGISAAAIDFGRASKVRGQLQRASDAAVDAMRLRLDEDRDVLQRAIRAYLDANLPVDLHEIPFAMVIPADRASIEVSMETYVPTTLMGVLGVTRLDVQTASLGRRPVLQPGLPAGVADGQHQAPADDAIRETVRQLTGPRGRPLPPEAAHAVEQQLRALEQLAAEAQRNGAQLPPELTRLLRDMPRR